MDISVIIVNYNVKAYLEQCLTTVFTALEGIRGEVFVVDNQSTDGSVEMVRQRFPQVRLIANRENVGFSRANNQAIREAGGRYVLLLNPDTVVGEDVFRKVVAFMDEHPRCGGLGVKMIDGRGRFLPESKRGLPTPQVAFFKIIGLTRLFPKSRLFGRYHLGHLPEDGTAPIEILSGACMFLRRTTLERVGLLDESFFMYGEDIDLSYRITLGGYENWYFPEARIIHYKGESTKKSSVNYVFVFYNAMAIFAKKHFTQRSAGIFPWLINGSIYLSAAAAIAVRFLHRTLLPLVDVGAMVLALALFPVLPDTWSTWPELGADLVIGFAAMAWLLLFGAYDRPVRATRPMPAMALLLALLAIILGVMGPLDPALLSAFATATGTMLAVRGILHLLRAPGHGIRRRERERIMAVGSPAEGRQALALLWQTHYGLGWTAVLEPQRVRQDPDLLADRIRAHRVGEVVFCSKDLGWGEIIATMERIKHLRVELKIAQPGARVIIGPSSIESPGDLFLLDGNTLASPGTRRVKRMTDILVSLALLLMMPLVGWFLRRPGAVVRNAVRVLLGRSSWVGYRNGTSARYRLPALPRGVFDTAGATDHGPDALEVSRLDATYAKDYHPWQDLRIIFRGLRAGTA